jgi:hypothetical protein
LDLDGLSVGIPGHDAATEGFEAPHPRLGAATGVVAPVQRFQKARPNRLVARRVSFLVLVAEQSSFLARPFRRMGMTAMPPRSTMAE